MFITWDTFLNKLTPKLWDEHFLKEKNLTCEMGKYDLVIKNMKLCTLEEKKRNLNLKFIDFYATQEPVLGHFFLLGFRTLEE